MVVMQQGLHRTNNNKLDVYLKCNFLETRLFYDWMLEKQNLPLYIASYAGISLLD